MIFFFWTSWKSLVKNDAFPVIFRISLSVPFCVSPSIYCCETNHSNLSGLEHSHDLSWVFGLAGHWTVFTRGFSCSYGQMSGRAVVIWRLEGAGQPSRSLVWLGVDAGCWLKAQLECSHWSNHTWSLHVTTWVFQSLGGQVLRRCILRVSIGRRKMRGQHDFRCTWVTWVGFTSEQILRVVLHWGRLAAVRVNSCSVLLIVACFRVRQALLILVFLQPFLVTWAVATGNFPY